MELAYALQDLLLTHAEFAPFPAQVANSFSKDLVPLVLSTQFITLRLVDVLAHLAFI
jgi:hypothetical protein